MKRVQATGKMNKHVGYAISLSEPDIQYQIVRRPDGTLKCACMSWAFSTSHPKTCKHIVGGWNQPRQKKPAKQLTLKETLVKALRQYVNPVNLNTVVELTEVTVRDWMEKEQLASAEAKQHAPTLLDEEGEVFGDVVIFRAIDLS